LIDIFRLIGEYGTAFCGRDRRQEPQGATAKCRGVRRAEGIAGGSGMRRDGGCGKRDSRSVEG